jgi:hypothetical protein
MMCDVVHFVAKCLECQQVKADHHHPTGLLQPHDVPMSKWEVISMDFVVGLPLTSHRHNDILVIVDKLTKIAHFIPIKDTYDVTDVARMFISEVIHLHGLPKKIISDRDSQFTSRFWTSLQSMLGTQLNLSTTYHPETNGKTERVNQVMEDILRMYVMDNQTHWEKYLPLVDVITLNCTTHAYLASGQLISLPCQSHAEQTLENPLKSSKTCPNPLLSALERWQAYYCTRWNAGRPTTARVYLTKHKNRKVADGTKSYGSVN